MGELATALVNRGRSMKSATFSTRDLQEQCRKSYVASYRANKGIGDLANYVIEGDSRRISSMNDSQYTVSINQALKYYTLNIVYIKLHK